MVFRFDEFLANPEWVQRRTEVANYGSVQWEGIFTARTNEGNKLVQRHRPLNDIGSIDFQMPVFPFVPALLFLLRSYPIEETILLLFRPRDLDISLRRTESMAPRFSLSFSPCSNSSLSLLFRCLSFSTSSLPHPFLCMKSATRYTAATTRQARSLSLSIFQLFISVT